MTWAFPSHTAFIISVLMTNSAIWTDSGNARLHSRCTQLQLSPAEMSPAQPRGKVYLPLTASNLETTVTTPEDHGDFSVRWMLCATPSATEKHRTREPGDWGEGPQVLSITPGRISRHAPSDSALCLHGTHRERAEVIGV